MITVIMVIGWRSRTPVVLMVIGVAGSLTITAVGKAGMGRSRPPLVDAVPPYELAPSFPSGHALNSTPIAYLILRRLRTTWARVLTVVLAVLWALAIGLSRVFLGHHWLTDVMFGWLIGSAWLALVITAHRLPDHPPDSPAGLARRTRPPDSPAGLARRSVLSHIRRQAQPGSRSDANRRGRSRRCCTTTDR